MHCVNDAAGEDAGDALLVLFAARLVSAAPDSFVARIGGDAFAVLTTASPLATAEAIGAAVASSPFTAGATEVRVTASIGVAEFPHHGDSADHLVPAAEAA